jgi:hypothetical protein
MPTLRYQDGDSPIHSTRECAGSAAVTSRRPARQGAGRQGRRSCCCGSCQGRTFLAGAIVE